MPQHEPTAESSDLFFISQSLNLFKHGHRRAFENVFLLSHISTVASRGRLSGKSSRVVATATDYTAAKLSPFLLLLQETRLIIPHKSALHVKRRFTIHEADNVSSRIVTEKSEQAPRRSCVSPSLPLLGHVRSLSGLNAKAHSRSTQPWFPLHDHLLAQ